MLRRKGEEIRMTNEEAIKYLKTMAECKKEIAEKLG